MASSRCGAWRQDFSVQRGREFHAKTESQMYRAGLASILSQLAREDAQVVENFVLDAPKTKLFLQKVTEMGVADSLLLITDQLDDNLVLSSRNLPNVLVLEVAEADPVSLIRYQNVILTRKAVGNSRDAGMNAPQTARPRRKQRREIRNA